jgi:dihydrodipicolinate synthase/N-acetylneuraminate lyase
VPVYLYSVPGKTGVALTPETVGELASHDTVHGMKDSSGDLVTLQRVLNRVDEDFELFVGHGGAFVQGIEAGAAGGILAVANVVPNRVIDVLEFQRTGRTAEARELGRRLVELNYVLTVEYGVPSVKAGMRLRDVPAGHVRGPHQPVSEMVEREIETLLESVLGA